MIICTKEEPIRPNGYLHAVDDVSGRIVHSTFTSDCLSRYSFLFRSKEVNDELIARLIEAIALQIETPVTWVVAWDDHLGELHIPIRAKAEASRRRRDGYSIYEEPGVVNSPQLSLGIKPKLFIAMKTADTFRHQNGDPMNFFSAFAQDFLIFGRIPPVSMFISSNTRATMDALARRHLLTPSGDFLKWIEQQQLSLLYQEPDIHENGYFVLVVVVSKMLDLEELLKKKIIDEVTTPNLST